MTKHKSQVLRIECKQHNMQAYHKNHNWKQLKTNSQNLYEKMQIIVSWKEWARLGMVVGGKYSRRWVLVFLGWWWGDRSSKGKETLISAPTTQVLDPDPDQTTSNSSYFSFFFIGIVLFPLCVFHFVLNFFFLICGRFNSYKS